MNGIVNLLKPSDMSSQQAVSAIKRIIPVVNKAGHSGTLDPAAAGVLPVFLDRATRLVEYTVDSDKEYIAQIQFGIATDTQDAQGRIVATSKKIIEYEEMKNLIDAIPYELWQKPPAYSAIKINGQKMVNLARRGIEKDIPLRRVLIYDKELIKQLDENVYLVRIHCSKGTYIRTICHDLGLQAGAYAHCSFLLRTKSGPFLLQDTVTFEELEEAVNCGSIGDLILPMDMAIMHLDRVSMSKAEASAITFGQTVQKKTSGMVPDQDRITSLWYRNTLIGIGIQNGDTIQPKKVFCEERDI